MEQIRPDLLKLKMESKSAFKTKTELIFAEVKRETDDVRRVDDPSSIGNTLRRCQPEIRLIVRTLMHVGSVQQSGSTLGQELTRMKSVGGKSSLCVD